MINQNLKFLKEFFLNLFFPKQCLGCHKEGEYLCQDCRALLEISDSQYCLCQKPKKVMSSGKCPICKSKNLSGLYFALSYQNPLAKKLIHLYKYPPYLKALAKDLAFLIITHFQLLEKPESQIWQGKILIPVPLTERRKKKRGFNQAEEIAKELSLFLNPVRDSGNNESLQKENISNGVNIPLFSNCLIKTKQTLAQVELSEKERSQNVKEAFFVKNKQLIKGQEILLVDDVYTTGSTMEEAAKVLKGGGAKRVWGVVVARG